MRIIVASSRYSAICDWKSGFRLISLNSAAFSASARPSLREIASTSCQKRSVISWLLASMQALRRSEARQAEQQSQKGAFWKIWWRQWLFMRLGGSLMPASMQRLRSRRVMRRLWRARCSRCSGESWWRWATKSSRMRRTMKVRIFERLLSRSLQIRAYCMSAFTDSQTSAKKASSLGEQAQPTQTACAGVNWYIEGMVNLSIIVIASLGSFCRHSVAVEALRMRFVEQASAFQVLDFPVRLSSSPSPLRESTLRSLRCFRASSSLRAWFWQKEWYFYRLILQLAIDSSAACSTTPSFCYG